MSRDGRGFQRNVRVVRRELLTSCLSNCSVPVAQLCFNGYDPTHHGLRALDNVQGSTLVAARPPLVFKERENRPANIVQRHLKREGQFAHGEFTPPQREYCPDLNVGRQRSDPGCASVLDRSPVESHGSKIRDAVNCGDLAENLYLRQ